MKSVTPWTEPNFSWK